MKRNAFLRCIRAIRPTLLFLGLAIGSVGPAQAGVLQRWDFRGDNPLHGLKIEGVQPTIVDDPFGSGKKVMRADLRTDSARPERSEVRWDTLKPGEEYWIGVKMLAPEATPQPFLSLFQIGPIKYPGNDSGAGGGWAQITQKISQSDGVGKWNLGLYFDRFGGNSINMPIETIAYGVWQQWIFHIKTSADKGVLEIWKGDRKIYDLRGQNIKADDFEVLPVKWGVYIGVGNKLVQNISSYYSAVLIADKNFDQFKMKYELEK